MKTLYLCFSDINGGAAKGAYRLHKGLQKAGINSKMLVKKKSSEDESVTQYIPEISEKKSKFNHFVTNKIYPKFRQKINDFASFNLTYTNVHNQINSSDADVLIMHWIGLDTINMKELKKIDKPIIWRLADMWAIDGGIHYNDKEGIIEYEKPQKVFDDVKAFLWHRKMRYLKNKSMTIVCGSQWLANRVQESPIYKNCNVLAIPSGIDITKFKPMNKIAAKKAFGINADSKVLLFGADTGLQDDRKGFDLLLEALQHLQKDYSKDQIKLMMFGTKEKYETTLEGFDAIAVGYINGEEELSKLYSAADVMVVPSRMDNLPFTAMEAITCGTPAVGFNIGGVPEIIFHQQTGYIAQPFDTYDLKEGIKWILENPSYNQMSKNCRKKAVTQFDVTLQTQKYINLANAIKDES